MLISDFFLAVSLTLMWWLVVALLLLINLSSSFDTSFVLVCTSDSGFDVTLL
jgi:hypothetical protein